MPHTESAASRPARRPGATDPAGPNGPASTSGTAATDAVTAHVLAYRPAVMSGQRWSQAADTVQTAVLAAAPATKQVAGAMLSSLTGFLAGPCGWDGRTSPDLSALLTENRITTVATQVWGQTRTAHNRAGDLRRIADALAATKAAAADPADPAGSTSSTIAAEPIATTPSIRKRTRRLPAVAPNVMAAAGLPCPFPTFAAWWQATQPTALTGDRLKALTKALTEPVTTPHASQNSPASQDSPAGRAPRLRALEELRKLSTQNPVTAMNDHATKHTEHAGHAGQAKPATANPAAPAAAAARTGRTAGPGRRTSGPVSRRARLAKAKASLAQAGAIANPKVVDIAPLPAEIAEVIDSFVPQKRTYRAAWAANRDLACRLVAGYRPTSPRNAANVCSQVAAFLGWYTTWPGRPALTTPASPGLSSDVGARPVDPFELRDPAIITAWMNAGVHKGRSVATLRSTMRRAIASLEGTRTTIRVDYTPPAAPYTPAELSDLVFMARNQPTQAATGRLCLLIGLCAGAGLDSADLRHLTAADITEHTLHNHNDHDGDHDGRSNGPVEDGEDGQRVLLVKITQGPRPRVTVVRESLAGLVRRGLELHTSLGKTPDDLLIGRSRERSNVVDTPARSALTSTTPVALDIRRLRNTWLLAAMCAPVSMRDLIAVTGFTSATPFLDLLAYCPTGLPVPAETVAVLRELS